MPWFKAFRRWAIHILRRQDDPKAFLIFMGVIALACTLSMSIPFGPLLSSGVMLQRQRWRGIALSSTVGSTLGALLLVVFFTSLGLAEAQREFPAVFEAEAWKQASGWVESYGLYALFVVSASPLPQTPFLLLCAYWDMPLAGIVLAIFLGKLIKYGVVAWTVNLMENEVIHLLRNGGLHADAVRNEKGEEEPRVPPPPL